MKNRNYKPWNLYTQDCLKGVPMHVPQGLVKLAAFDPPYNIGQPYSDYVDTKTQGDYLEYVGDRIAVTKRYMHPHGSMWVAINDANVSELDVLCKRLGLFPRRKVIWHFTFGQHNSKNLTPSHVTWLYYTLHRTKFTFNPDAIRVPSARAMLYNDKRAHSKGRLPNDVWVLLPQFEPAAFEPPDNTWLFSRVCGTFKAKIAESPNQMPVAMMDRIVRLCSDPDDTVLDIFSGTGTTGKAAILSGRKYIGFDKSKVCNDAAEKSFADAVARVAEGAKQLELFTEDQCKGKRPNRRSRR